MVAEKKLRANDALQADTGFPTKGLSSDAGCLKVTRKQTFPTVDEIRTIAR